MDRDKFCLLSLYLKGFALVFLHVGVTALLLTWGLQFVALILAETYNWAAVFQHIFLSMSLLVLFPGQQLWTYRLEGRDKKVHTIVGRQSYYDHYPQ